MQAKASALHLAILACRLHMISNMALNTDASPPGPRRLALRYMYKQNPMFNQVTIRES